MTGRSEAGIAADADNVAVMVDAFRLLVGRLPGSTRDEAEGVATFFGHVPMAFFNISIFSRPLRDPAAFRRALDLALARARACAHPSFIGLIPPWSPPDAEAILAGVGLAPATLVTGMAADRLLDPRRPAPRLDVRLAGLPGVARDLAVINAQAYGMAEADAACLAEPALWRDGNFGVVGYADGRAVSCAASFLVGEVIYVAMVATLPGAHGRGYAEAVMRHAIGLTQSAAGPRRIWLHATEMGRPLYQSMGFETGAAVPLYAPAG